jgi:lipopolysaccharide transport system permease protein
MNDRSALGKHTSLRSAAANVLRHRGLVWQLTKRDVLGRYRGSLLGIVWSLVNPLLMLGVYTFVFGFVFKTKWGGKEAGTLQFTLVLFAGLIVYNLFAECVNRAPSLIVSQPNLVKKVVFPLELLPVVQLASALFHALVSLVVLLVAFLLLHGVPPLTALLLPVVIAPLCGLCLGFAWLLASLGVYLRDVGQVVAIVTSALMFLSPLFFPLSALPGRVQRVVLLNPLSIPIEQTRRVLLWGQAPDWPPLLAYTAAAIAAMWAGYWWFQRTRNGFADVL